jgi:hypothetical protein
MPQRSHEHEIQPAEKIWRKEALTKCSMSFLGGIVGIPSKGKSIVAISSNHSAYVGETEALCFRRTHQKKQEKNDRFSSEGNDFLLTALVLCQTDLLFRRDELVLVTVPGPLPRTRHDRNQKTAEITSTNLFCCRKNARSDQGTTESRRDG